MSEFKVGDRVESTVATVATSKGEILFLFGGPNPTRAVIRWEDNNSESVYFLSNLKAIPSYPEDEVNPNYSGAAVFSDFVPGFEFRRVTHGVLGGAFTVTGMPKKNFIGAWIVESQTADGYSSTVNTFLGDAGATRQVGGFWSESSLVIPNTTEAIVGYHNHVQIQGEKK